MRMPMIGIRACVEIKSSLHAESSRRWRRGRELLISTQALIPILGILIYYLGFRDDIWEDMGGKAEL